MIQADVFFSFNTTIIINNMNTDKVEPKLWAVLNAKICHERHSVPSQHFRNCMHDCKKKGTATTVASNEHFAHVCSVSSEIDIVTVSMNREQKQ